MCVSRWTCLLHCVSGARSVSASRLSHHLALSSPLSLSLALALLATFSLDLFTAGGKAKPLKSKKSGKKDLSAEDIAFKVGTRSHHHRHHHHHHHHHGSLTSPPRQLNTPHTTPHTTEEAARGCQGHEGCCCQAEGRQGRQEGQEEIESVLLCFKHVWLSILHSILFYMTQ